MEENSDTLSQSEREMLIVTYPDSEVVFEAITDSENIIETICDPEGLNKIITEESVGENCESIEAANILIMLRENIKNKKKSLIEACCDGDVNAVCKFLTEGQSVHETSEEGDSLLSLACAAGHYELAKVLLDMHANVNDRCSKNHTPLMKATLGGFVEIIRLLVSHGADVDAISSPTGNTSLMYACEKSHAEIIEELLNYGADTEYYNNNGFTALMQAANDGNILTAKILLEHGACLQTYSIEFKESALTLASYRGHLNMVRLLLANGIDQENKTCQMFHALKDASFNNHVEVARVLLNSGAPANEQFDDLSPLGIAAGNGYVDLALLLMEYGANIDEINEDGYTPLMEAAQEGHADIVSILLSKGANINAESKGTQRTALSIACCGGFLDVAGMLIKNGALLERGALTPLMEAASEGYQDVVLYLLKCGADVHTQSLSGDTALDYACRNGHTGVANLLHRFGANLENESKDGYTPLMKACQAGHLGTVQFLILNNADINKVSTNKGHTALSLACSEGHFPVVSLLLEYNADPSHKLKDNSTMVIAAARGGHTNIIKLFFDYPLSMMSDPFENAAPAQESPLNKTVLPEVQIMSKAHDITDSVIDSCRPDKKPNAVSSTQDPLIMKAQLNASNSFNDCRFKIRTPNGIDTINCSTSKSFAISTGIEQQFKIQENQDVTSTQHTSISTLNHSRLKHVNINVDSQTIIMCDTALTIACAGGHEDLVEYLLSIGANIEHRDVKYFTPLMIAASFGFDKIVEILLDNDCDIEGQTDTSKETALTLACSRNHHKVCEILLQRGANKEHRNNYDFTPLIIVSSCGYTNIIKLLLNYGAKMNTWTGISPLMLAAMNGHTAAVQLLLDKGCNINAQIDFNRYTALTLACSYNKPNIVALLLDRKANKEHRTNSGLTPLMEAARAGFVDVGRVLIDKGADVDAYTFSSFQETAFTIAASMGHIHFIKLLLEKNAKFETKNKKKGSSALWFAARGGHLPVIKLLYEVGANIDFKDSKNVSCLMVALNHGHISVVKWMAIHVSQFPSEPDINKFISTLNDQELIEKCQNCLLAIKESKDQLAAKALENASKLLQEIYIKETKKQQKNKSGTEEMMSTSKKKLRKRNKKSNKQ